MFSFEDLTLFVPPEVYVDSSFVAAALVPAEPRYEAARAFLVRLVDSGSIIYFGSLLRLELAEASYRIACREVDSNWRRARADGRVRRRVDRLTRQVLGEWAAILTQIEWAEVALDEAVLDLVPAYMRLGLGSYDAAHAASAAAAGVRSFVTLDYGFAVLPKVDFDLFVPSARASGMRRARRLRDSRPRRGRE